MKTNPGRRFVSTRASSLTALMAVMTVMTSAAISPSMGIAQTNQSRRIADLNDTSAILSREIPSDWLDQLNAMPNLKKLTIRNPVLQKIKFSQLRELKNLTEFSAEDFSMNTRLADIVAVNIAQLPRLKSVQFHRTGLTGRGLDAFSQSSTEELILDGEELITDADFKHVALMPSLKTLELDSTPIDVDGLTILQAASGLRRLVLRRHPAGSIEKGSEARVKAIAGFQNLEELELGDAGYNHLVALKESKSLRLLTLRHCGGNDASKSLKQLTQLKRVEIDNCDIRDESFEDVKSELAEIKIAFADVTRHAADLLTRSTLPPDEATLLARRALEELDVGQRFPSFWIGWHHHWSKIPTMIAEPIRSVHRLKQALTAEHEIQPWQQDVTFAYAPGQFFIQYLSTSNDASNWQQTTYGDTKLAWSREGRTGKPFLYILRGGVREFEESMGHRFPRQLFITHQHMWWGTSTNHNTTSSPVPPQKVEYIELPEEDFAGEACRVFQAPGRSERLWISRATGRLRGALHYIHQGYFTPFYKQDVVTKLVGRRVESHDEYNKLFGESGTFAKEVQLQLSQAWAEHEFSRAYPGNLVVLDDFREIATGKWFPFKVTTSSWLHNEKNQGKYDFNVSESVVTGVAIDRNDLEPHWSEFLPKTGDKVQDQRYDVSVEYPFNKDRTEEEIQTLVNDRLLQFARSEIQVEKAQSPFTKLTGKPAPELGMEGWIGDRPELTGKRYLIHFWAAWCGPCKNDVPLLNSIAKSRIVIGVHPGDTTIEQVTKVVKDYKMVYPTVVAPRDAQDVMGYPAKMFPYCVEVDEQGHVAKHGFLQEVLGVNVRNDVMTTHSPKTSGSILAIDAMNGLAVISLGESDGIQAKQLLDVVREGKSIAQMRVITLHKNRCVGKTTDEIEQPTLKTGDKVLSFDTTLSP